MPIYEYQCQDCQEVTEVLQKLSDAPKVDCPACGKPSLKKKVSAVAFRLKGGGWYETDFKTGKKKNLAGDSGASTSSDSSGSKTATGKSESNQSSKKSSKEGSSSKSTKSSTA